MADTTIQPPPEKPVTRLPLRTRRSFARRMAKNFRTKARDAFSREQLVASLKSLGWVAPMTILIWIYAEREQTDKQPVQFRVEARNNDPTRLVELRGPGSDGHLTTAFVVHAEFSGPKKSLDGVREKLEGGGELQIEIPDGLPTGNTPVSASSLLVNDPLLVKEGLTITSIVPSQIEVVIDPIEHRSVRVSARPAVTNLEEPSIFKPASIEVTGPKSVLDAAAKNEKLIAYADLPALTDPGPKSLTNISITVPINDPHLNVSPATVSAEVTVKKSDLDGVIAVLPVWAIYPPLDGWDKYKAVYERTLADVKVSGPPDLIRDLNDPVLGPKPRALLDLKVDGGALGPNLVGKEFKGTIHYELGDSRFKIAPDAPKELTYTIQER